MTRRPANGEGAKGRFEMFSQSKIVTTLIAAVGSLLLSSVAVTAAVGPAHVVETGSEVRTYA
jgi:hypothetical protein